MTCVPAECYVFCLCSLSGVCFLVFITFQYLFVVLNIYCRVCVMQVKQRYLY